MFKIQFTTRRYHLRHLAKDTTWRTCLATMSFASGVRPWSIGRWALAFGFSVLGFSLKPSACGRWPFVDVVRPVAFPRWSLASGRWSGAFGLWASPLCHWRCSFAAGVWTWALGRLPLGVGFRQLAFGIKSSACGPWPLESSLSALTFGPRDSSRASVLVPMSSVSDSGLALGGVSVLLLSLVGVLELVLTLVLESLPTYCPWPLVAGRGALALAAWRLALGLLPVGFEL